ncbi:hypothetical protein IWZ01DRAFT_228209 [Phyllosticta capitalensis]
MRRSCSWQRSTVRTVSTASLAAILFERFCLVPCEFRSLQLGRRTARQAVIQMIVDSGYREPRVSRTRDDALARENISSKALQGIRTLFFLSPLSTLSHQLASRSSHATNFVGCFPCLATAHSSRPPGMSYLPVRSTPKARTERYSHNSPTGMCLPRYPPFCLRTCQPASLRPADLPTTLAKPEQKMREMLLREVVVLTINFYYSRMGSNVGWLRDSNDCTSSSSSRSRSRSHLSLKLIALMYLSSPQTTKPLETILPCLFQPPLTKPASQPARSKPPFAWWMTYMTVPGFRRDAAVARHFRVIIIAHCHCHGRGGVCVFLGEA